MNWIWFKTLNPISELIKAALVSIKSDFSQIDEVELAKKEIIEWLMKWLLELVGQALKDGANNSVWIWWAIN